MMSSVYLTKGIFVILLLLLFYENAYAYLDAGTGSYLIQILVAFFVGGVFAVKLSWGYIKTFFQKHFSKKEEETEE